MFAAVASSAERLQRGRVGMLSTGSLRWTDERESCTVRALWPVAGSLYNSLPSEGQTRAKSSALPLPVTPIHQMKTRSASLVHRTQTSQNCFPL